MKKNVWPSNNEPNNQRTIISIVFLYKHQHWLWYIVRMEQFHSCHPGKINKNKTTHYMCVCVFVQYIHLYTLPLTIIPNPTNHSSNNDDNKKKYTENIKTHKLTFFTNRFICLLARHHVTVAGAGLEPELLHSTSYVLSADTNFSFVKIWTAVGFTVNYKTTQFQLIFLVCLPNVYINR